MELPFFEPNLQGLISVIVTFLLPLIVGAITTANMSSRARALTLAGLAVVKTVGEAVLANLINNVAINTTAIIYGALISFALAAALHFGLWKPTGATATVRSLRTPTEAPKAPAVKRTTRTAAPKATKAATSTRNANRKK